MKNRKGFTLIEFMIVVAILGILAAVAVPKFMDLSAQADLKKQGYNTGKVREWMEKNYSDEGRNEWGVYYAFKKSKKLQQEFKDGPSRFSDTTSGGGSSSFSDTKKCNCSCNR